MPPSETKLGKEMGKGDKAVILAWIKTLDAATGGTIATTTDPTTNDSNITGDLMKLSDANCASCHVDAAKTSF